MPGPFFCVQLLAFDFQNNPETSEKSKNLIFSIFEGIEALLAFELVCRLLLMASTSTTETTTTSSAVAESSSSAAAAVHESGRN